MLLKRSKTTEKSFKKNFNDLVNLTHWYLDIKKGTIIGIIQYFTNY